MASLTLKSGTKTEVKDGSVVMAGNCVLLSDHRPRISSTLVIAYCLAPGEIVRRQGEGDDYVVEY